MDIRSPVMGVAQMFNTGMVRNAADFEIKMAAFAFLFEITLEEATTRFKSYWQSLPYDWRYCARLVETGASDALEAMKEGQGMDLDQ